MCDRWLLQKITVTAICIVAVTIHYYSLTEAVYTRQQILDLGKYCNGTEEDINVALQYKVPSTDTGKCLMNCMVKILGMLTPPGEYNETGSLIAMKTYWREWSDKELEWVTSSCNEELKDKKLTEKLECERGYQVIRCINAKTTELGLPKITSEVKSK